MLPLWDNQPHTRPAVVTPLLITANITEFAYQLLLMAQGGGQLETFLMRHALVPARLWPGWDDPQQWLTLVTHQFLHGGVAHLLGNCWFLWIFGRSAEDKLGPARFLLFYLLGGFGAALLQIAVGPFSDVPMIGASGAISGILGAYFILLPTAWIIALVPWIVPILPVPAFVFLILWFALQTMNGFGVLLGGTAGEGGVAWWAHAGGFVAGVILTRRSKSNRRGGRRA